MKIIGTGIMKGNRMRQLIQVNQKSELSWLTCNFTNIDKLIFVCDVKQCFNFTTFGCVMTNSGNI